MKKWFLLWALSLCTVQGMAQVTKEVTLSESGKLKSQISSSEAKTIEKLIVNGEMLNAKDMEFIGKMQALRTLDISGASIIRLTELKKPVTNVRTLILSRLNDPMTPATLPKEVEMLSDIYEAIKNLTDSYAFLEWRGAFPSMETYMVLPKSKCNWMFLPQRCWYNANAYCLQDGTIVWEKNSNLSHYSKENVLMAYMGKGYDETKKWATTADLSGKLFISRNSFPSCNLDVLTIPSEVRYIGEQAFYNKVINMTRYTTHIKHIQTEKTEQPLYIKQFAFSTYESPSVIKNITFNRPVYIEHGAFANCDLESVTFNDDVIFLDKEAFTSATVLNFAKVPQKLSRNFVGSYTEAHIPSGTESQFANLGLSREKLFEEGGELLTLSIKMEKPGTILSHLPADKLSNIGSLTIIGFLYETDIQILSQLRSMTYLDISKTYTTYSPDYLKRRREQQEYQAAMLKLLGKAATADYIDGNMAPSDYFFTQALVKIASEEPIDEAEPGCILPDEAFKGLRKLETIKLPLRLSSMGNKVLRSCTNLKHVEMPPHLQSIGTGSFGVCRNLENIIIPSSLKSIGDKGLEADPYGPDPHVCTFDFSGVKTLDFSQCVFEKDDWLDCLRECNNLQSVRLPQNIKWVSNLSISPNVDYYFPVTLKAFLQFWGGASNANLHFKSQTPPDLSGNTITNCTIYCPKDCTTAYYSKFGAGNKYIEE